MHYPRKQNSRRISLLLLLGNPPSHSVHSRMFFSYERDGGEHRFWKALKKAGILSFTAERNEQRKTELFNLSYPSPFRIGLATFYSMPSGASGKLSGVGGLRNLFGRKALTDIGNCEKYCVEELIKKFLPPNGAVFTFQKDAYLGIKNPASPDYHKEKVMKGELFGSCECNRKFKFFCLPPTQLILAKKTLGLLGNFKERVLKSS